MYEQLIDDAMKNVWCNPYMDRSSIIVPKRISPAIGIRHEFRFPWSTLMMPTRDERYHLYQIGHIPNSFVGVLKKLNGWVDVATICMENDLNVDAYIISGLEIAKSMMFMHRDPNGTLFYAVKDYPSMPRIQEHPLHLRFYANSFAQSQRANHLEGLITVNGGIMDTKERILEVLNDFYTRQQESEGYVYLQHNGVEVGTINPAGVQVGDVLEMVDDRSVKHFIDFPLRELPTFDSTLDGRAKYLLHPPKDGTDTIDYYDDVDILIIDTRFGQEGNWKGMRYHTNAKDAIRMVTHQDYSIPVEYVETYVTEHPDIYAAGTIVVRLIVKHAGYKRELTHNASKVHELYKLDDVEIPKQMTGMNALIAEWRAENLEASTHTLMYSHPDRFTAPQVLKGLGYDAAMKKLFNSPIEAYDDGGTFELHLPWGLQVSSTVYEYDADGCLLGFYLHQAGAEYYPRHPEMRRAEVFRGPTSQIIDMETDANLVELNTELDYHFYVLTAVEESGLVGEWRKAVLDEDYRIEEGIIRWDIDPRLKTSLAYTDAIALGYDVLISSDAGHIEHQITRKVILDEILIDQPLEIPLGKLDVWLNGNLLIKDVDYVLTAGQKIHVFNKQYMVDEPNQKLTIRWAGFHGYGYGDFTDYEVGFVHEGLLSKNSKYDLRDDRLVRCIVDGKLKSVDELNFDEEHSGVGMPDVADGTPYIIEYSKPPLWGVEDMVDADWRDKSLALDTLLSSYLTSLNPPPPLPKFVSIVDHHNLYSPFIGAIIADIVAGNIEIENKPLLDDELVSLALPYLYLIDVDPSKHTLELNRDLFAIHPHPYQNEVRVQVHEFAALERLSMMYLDDKVDMTQYVRVGSD